MPEGAFERGAEEDRVLRRVVPVAGALVPAAIRAIAREGGARRGDRGIEHRARELRRGFRRDDAGGDEAAGADQRPVMRGARPEARAAELREPGLERVGDQRADGARADRRVERVVAPVDGERHGHRHLGDVEEMRRVPGREGAGGLELRADAPREALVLREQPGHAEVLDALEHLARGRQQDRPARLEFPLHRWLREQAPGLAQQRVAPSPAGLVRGEARGQASDLRWRREQPRTPRRQPRRQRHRGAGGQPQGERGRGERRAAAQPRKGRKGRPAMACTKVHATSMA